MQRGLQVVLRYRLQCDRIVENECIAGQLSIHFMTLVGRQKKAGIDVTDEAEVTLGYVRVLEDWEGGTVW